MTVYWKVQGFQHHRCFDWRRIASSGKNWCLDEKDTANFPSLAGRSLSCRACTKSTAINKYPFLIKSAGLIWLHILIKHLYIYLRPICLRTNNSSKINSIFDNSFLHMWNDSSIDSSTLCNYQQQRMAGDILSRAELLLWHLCHCLQGSRNQSWSGI